MVGMFGGGENWRIWQITDISSKFTIQILTMSRDINKANKQAFIKVLLAKSF